MKQIYAECIFSASECPDLAANELTAGGFDVEKLDWLDEHEGVLLSATTWLAVRGASELDGSAFADAVQCLIWPFGGDVIEAGLE